MKKSKSKKLLSKKRWQEFVQKNSCSSYSLSICLAVLMLWEAGVKTRNKALDKLLECHLGLSGFQAEVAVDMALNKHPHGWLDKNMCKAMRARKERLNERRSVRC